MIMASRMAETMIVDRFSVIQCLSLIHIFLLRLLVDLQFLIKFVHFGLLNAAPAQKKSDAPLCGKMRLIF